tara:strand:+ start:7 stop:780 length:774 start_codon:yes stop_codon:yes gene_type:complete
MKKEVLSTFNEQGYYLARGLFSQGAISYLEKEFDKIVKQMNASNENINARWGSDLTKTIEDPKSMVLHTHNVQSYSQKMLNMVQDKHLLDVVESLIGPDIVLHHTKLFLKPPKIGSAFPLHQDWSYFPTHRNSMIAAVVHISKSKEDMGRIRLVKGSHKVGRVKGSDGHSYIKDIHGIHDLESAHVVDADPGDVLFFHCCLLHGSKANESENSRKTVLIQLYSGTDKVEYSTHANVQLALRGWNHNATRSSVNEIGV